jgi:hypothetical protein
MIACYIPKKRHKNLYFSKWKNSLPSVIACEENREISNKTERMQNIFLIPICVQKRKEISDLYPTYVDKKLYYISNIYSKRR